MSQRAFVLPAAAPATLGRWALLLLGAGLLAAVLMLLTLPVLLVGFLVGAMLAAGVLVARGSRPSGRV